MKPKRFLLISGAILSSGILLISLFYSGILRFNYPDRKTFPIQGIDVSHHQGEIDWKEVKQEGIDFAYIKATEGGDFVDPRFQENLAGATENGITAGAYHFFTLCTSGAEQSGNFISTAPANRAALPPAIDLEFSGNCRSKSNRIDFESEFEVFFETIRKHYDSYPVIYTTYEFYETYDLSKYRDQLWIRDIFFEPDESLSWTFWQYTNRLSIKGISGPVDGNVFTGNRERFLGLQKSTYDRKRNGSFYCLPSQKFGCAPLQQRRF